MSALLLLNRTDNMQRRGSLQSFAEYRDVEAVQKDLGYPEGGLLEYETLELRLHPPNVVIDNDSHEDVTIITVDSANRPGTLVEVVQCLTELNLTISKARISSDGGWFVDEFYVTELPYGKVVDPKKLREINRVLNVDPLTSRGTEIGSQGVTVLELAGQDRLGLLHDVMQLLLSNNCTVHTLAVWTHAKRCAFVLSITERGLPLRDSFKLHRLRQLLTALMTGEDKDAAVNIIKVYAQALGPVHHERRLHVLLLREEERMMSSAAPAAYDMALARGASEITLDEWVTANRPRSRPAWSDHRMDASPKSGMGLDEAIDEDGSPSTITDETAQENEGHPFATPSSPEPAADQQPDAPPRLKVARGHPQELQGGEDGTQEDEVGARDQQRAKRIGSAPDCSPAGCSGLPPLPPLVARRVTSGPLEYNRAPLLEPAAKQSQVEISIQHSKLLNYWIINIRCRDRPKLLFDCVCTLADLEYDVYHAAIDTEAGDGLQMYYVRPRYADYCNWNPQQADKLKRMLESAVQRRFPPGLKIYVQSTNDCTLPQLLAAFKMHNLTIARAKVRTLGGHLGHTFYLMDASGVLPNTQTVRAVCEAIGGRCNGLMVEQAPFQASSAGSSESSHDSPRARPPLPPSMHSAFANALPTSTSSDTPFTYSIMERRWHRNWLGRSASQASSN